MTKEIYIIVAVDKKNGIGKNGKMPWDFKKEMKFFKETTLKTQDPNKKNMVIMGRTTWESIPEKFRPLKGRKNILLTHRKEYKAKGATICHSLEETFDQADETIEKVFIIGGAKVYQETISLPQLTGLYITKINKTYDCDTFFPEVPKKFLKETELGKDAEEGVEFKFLLYKLKTNSN